MMQANSFISNFKTHKKSIKTAVSIVVFLILFIFVHKLLCFLLIDDTESYTRITLHELYNQEENIDVLFLGSSHCFLSLNTDITDTLFDANTFNAGSASQFFDGSYALLVEAGKNNNLQRVYVEIYCGVIGYKYKGRTEMTSTYIISDYMRPSINKFLYLLNSADTDYWIHGFLPETRVNKNTILDFQYILSLFREKTSESYRNYNYVGNPETDASYYAGKGYVANTNEVINGNFSNVGHYGSLTATFSPDDIQYIDNIITYCQKHNIELIFFSAPMPDFRLADMGNYDSYISYITEFFSEYNIPYYDFNLCREEYFSYNSNLFMDDHHLNKSGAELFSTIFSDFFNGRIAEEDLFYSSYEEKMNSLDNLFYGLIYNIENTENTKIYTFPVSGKNQ